MKTKIFPSTCVHALLHYSYRIIGDSMGRIIDENYGLQGGGRRDGRVSWGVFCVTYIAARGKCVDARYILAKHYI